ncbi:hypothetical protein P4H32_26395 [Bacillus cereus]|nr:hypothetical protein [Bacillus cereus]
MKLRKYGIFTGLFFFFSQFGTVGVYGLLMAIAQDHNIPTEQLAKYLTLIMNTVIIVFIAFSILFLLLLLGMVWRTWTGTREAESRSQQEPASSLFPE